MQVDGKGLTLSVSLDGRQLRELAELVANLLADREPDDRLLSTDEAAEFLRCPRGRVYDLVPRRT